MVSHSNVSYVAMGSCENPD